MVFVLSFSKMLEFGFWFSASPARLSRSFLWVGIVLCGVLVLGAGVLRLAQVYYRSQPVIRAVVRRSSTMATTIGLVGFVFLFFRQEEVYLFSSRAWFFVWAGLILWSIISLIRIGRLQRERIKPSTSRG